jgi:hypothetical protein
MLYIFDNKQLMTWQLLDEQRRLEQFGHHL